MPLTLVTGPANAEKAGVVLGAYRRWAPRGALLVVPTAADVDRYRRELADEGVVFGARVLTFDKLVDELALRAGIEGRPVSPLAAERVAATAIARTELRVLGTAAATPGFARALLRLATELGGQRIGAARLYAALRAWAAQDPGRAGHAEDVAALYAAYHRGLEALGRRDGPGRATAALDVLRREPRRWAGTPVCFYGFDDFTELQLDAVETLAVRVEAEVVVSLAYEPGRAAFGGPARAFVTLEALAGEHVRRPARAEHYAPGARTALHHLERSLFEPDPGRVDPGDAVALLEGGGPQAELELVAAHVARLLREGVEPEEVAVVMRAPRHQAAALHLAFAAAGVPVALDRVLPAGHTALGRGLLALLRCATRPGEATAEDLLAYLRTPGLLQRPELADRLEVDLRQQAVADAAGARARWEARHWPLDALTRVAGAAREGVGALCARLAAELEALFAAPLRRRAPLLDEGEQTEARVARTLGEALRELERLAGLDPALVPGGVALERLLAEQEVRLGARPGPGRVTVADPLAVRARRVRALVVCGLQEGAFPQAPVPEPFFGDPERRAINAASGLRLALHEDRLGRERTLMYAAVSRPTELLALAWHVAEEDGGPAVRSLFVDDVLDLLEPLPPVQVRRLGEAGWVESPALAPTARAEALTRAVEDGDRAPAAPPAIAPLRDESVLAGLAAREAWSASALETWVACPVRWFVERLLAPDALRPDPEPMVRGQLAHGVLEETFRRLAVEDADHPGVTPENLPEARRHAVEALRELVARTPFPITPERLRPVLHRLEADVVRYLDHAAVSGTELLPTAFELSFGGAADPHGPVELRPGLKLRGRMDRVDRSQDGAEAFVYDYKGRTTVPQARWAQDGKLQLALYVLALPELLDGVRAAGGLYQPLGARKLTPRGLVAGDADPGQRLAANDRVDPERFEAVLAQALDAAEQAVGEIRAGALRGRPERCSPQDGCRYPSICRCA